MLIAIPEFSILLQCVWYVKSVLLWGWFQKYVLLLLSYEKLHTVSLNREIWKYGIYYCDPWKSSIASSIETVRWGRSYGCRTAASFSSVLPTHFLGQSISKAHFPALPHNTLISSSIRFLCRLHLPYSQFPLFQPSKVHLQKSWYHSFRPSFIGPMPSHGSSQYHCYLSSGCWDSVSSLQRRCNLY